MDVITIESRAFRNIMDKLEALEQRFSNLKKESETPLGEKWLDNADVCKLLYISKRTLQTYRDEKLLPFSQINHKIYYKASDIERFLKKHYNSRQR